MNPEEAALLTVVQVLTRLSIPFMVTGSVASSYHGHPRSTHDADVVIDPTSEQLDALIGRLQAEEFYLDADTAHEALRTRGQFNAIEMRHACKIDLIVRRDRPYSVEEFTRRVRADFPFAKDVPVVSPEDAIVSKLEWARRAGDSERQITERKASSRSIRAWIEPTWTGGRLHWVLPICGSASPTDQRSRDHRSVGCCRDLLTACASARVVVINTHARNDTAHTAVITSRNPLGVGDIAEWNSCRHVRQRMVPAAVAAGHGISRQRLTGIDRSTHARKKPYATTATTPSAFS